MSDDGKAQSEGQPSTKRRTVDITPDVSLIKKAGEVNYTIPQALADLVDNSVDASKPGRKTTVEIKIGQKDGEKYASVLDDASGMTPDEAADAMTMARSSKQGKKIGEFGFGLKTASSFLGSHVEIVTCTPDQDFATRLVYDEDAFVETGKWALDLEEVEKPFDHGTLVTVTSPKVNLYPGVKNTILSSFGKTYRHFIANGELEIIVNGDAVQPMVHETIKEFDTEIKFDIGGKTVRGWASLAPHGSGRGMYGFDLVRNNRVMAEYEKIGFKANSSYTNITGELHLDDFPVTNNKTAFRVDTEEWNELNKQVGERIVDLLRANRAKANPGRNMSAKDEADVKEHIDKVQKAVAEEGMLRDLDRRALDQELASGDGDGPIPFKVAGDEEDGTPDVGGGGGGGGGGGEREPSSVTRQRLSRVKTELRSITIEHNIMKLGRDSAYKIWDIEGVGNRKKLVVTTNADHPFFEVIGDGLMLWIKHSIVESVAEYLNEATAGDVEAFMLLKSDILKHVGRIDLAVMEEKPWIQDEGEFESETA